MANLFICGCVSWKILAGLITALCWDAIWRKHLLIGLTFSVWLKLMASRKQLSKHNLRILIIGKSNMSFINLCILIRHGSSGICSFSLVCFFYYYFYKSNFVNNCAVWAKCFDKLLCLLLEGCESKSHECLGESQ